MKTQKATTIVIICVVLPVLSTVAVALRRYAQGTKSQRLSIDEAFIISALVLVFGLSGTTIYGAADGGVGWGPNDVNPAIGNKFRTVLFAHQIVWGASIALIRTGLLLFYRRIFAMPRFINATNIMMGMTGAWFLAYFVGMFFAYSWRVVDEPPVYLPTWLLTHALINMVFDFVTLSLPLTVIRTLKISYKKKVYVMGIFSIGGFCVFSSVMRVVYFVTLYSVSEREMLTHPATFNSLLWSQIEPSTSIIAACLPTLGPLLSKSNGGAGLSTLVHNIVSTLSMGGRLLSGRSRSSDRSHQRSPPQSSPFDPTDAGQAGIVKSVTTSQSSVKGLELVQATDHGVEHNRAFEMRRLY